MSAYDDLDHDIARAEGEGVAPLQQAASGLRAGLMGFHNGRPVELLSLVSKRWDPAYAEYVEVWEVRPLFVEKRPHFEVFRCGDHLTPLHSKSR